jgi:3-oxoacyl-[acyl-carrier-protein] synthase II
VTGHLIGAAGAAEAVTCILSARKGLVPPTANFERPDPGIAVDVVAGSAREVSGPVVSNSFGFGGHNATLVIGAAEA